MEKYDDDGADGEGNIFIFNKIIFLSLGKVVGVVCETLRGRDIAKNRASHLQYGETETM